MKRIFLVVILFNCITFSSFAQIKVPDKVKSAFEGKFPNATALRWEADVDEYTADFTSDSVDFFAVFNEDGKWIETGITIAYENLPDAVKKSVKDKFKDNEIKCCYKVEDFKGMVYYEVDIKKDSRIIELYFNKDGTEADDD